MKKKLTDIQGCDNYHGWKYDFILWYKNPQQIKNKNIYN